jgi:hypothetical protein
LAKVNADSKLLDAALVLVSQAAIRNGILMKLNIFDSAVILPNFE